MNDTGSYQRSPFGDQLEAWLSHCWWLIAEC